MAVALAMDGLVTVAVALSASGDPELLAAQRAFHAAAGAGPDAAGAEWVLEAGEGEFWWPRGGSLVEVLGAVPGRYGAVQALVRHFIPVGGGDPPFERMIYRYAPRAPAHSYEPLRRLAARVAGGPTLRGWYPLELLRLATGEPALGEDDVARGREQGVLVEDTRLRDALRLVAQGRKPEFPRPDVTDEALLAVDAAILGEADVLRAHERLDELEGRLSLVESTLPARIERKLRTVVRRRRP